MSNRPSHIDIENRIDDAEELEALNAKLRGDEAMEGYMDWIEEQERSVEWQAELAEHMSAAEMGAAVNVAVESVSVEPIAVKVQLGGPPIPVWLVREAREVILT